MARHEVHLGDGLLEELRRRLGDELVRGAVETVLADPVLLVVLRVQSVLRGIRRHRLVERRVEHADVRHALEDLLARLHAAEVRRHVERAEFHELFALREIRLVHYRGVLENLRAVQDAVAYRVHLGEGLEDPVLRIGERGHDFLERGRVVRRLDVLRELVLARLLVDEPRAGDADALDEPLAEHLLALHVEELELQRRRTAIDD